MSIVDVSTASARTRSVIISESGIKRTNSTRGVPITFYVLSHCNGNHRKLRRVNIDASGKIKVVLAHNILVTKKKSALHLAAPSSD